MSREARETIADWLMLLAALTLIVSLFLTWSHQLPGSVQHANPALSGVPRNPTAWQVYSIADVLLAAVAVTLVAVSFVGTRTARLTALVPVGIALAFVIHASGHPPTNGVALPALAIPRAHSGAGETVALIAIGLGLGALALSFTADP